MFLHSLEWKFSLGTFKWNVTLTTLPVWFYVCRRTQQGCHCCWEGPGTSQIFRTRQRMCHPSWHHLHRHQKHCDEYVHCLKDIGVFVLDAEPAHGQWKRWFFLVCCKWHNTSLYCVGECTWALGLHVPDFQCDHDAHDDALNDKASRVHTNRAENMTTVKPDFLSNVVSDTMQVWQQQLWWTAAWQCHASCSCWCNVKYGVRQVPWKAKMAGAEIQQLMI